MESNDKRSNRMVQPDDPGIRRNSLNGYLNLRPVQTSSGQGGQTGNSGQQGEGAQTSTNTPKGVVSESGQK